MIRVYVDDFTPPIWEVDSGPRTPSQKFELVISESIGFFRYNLLADNNTEPKAWVEYPEGKLIVINNVAIIR